MSEPTFSKSMMDLIQSRRKLTQTQIITSAINSLIEEIKKLEFD